MPPISILNHIHWVDRIKVEVCPLKLEGGSKQLVKIFFYSDGEVNEKFEVCAFTNHELVDVKAEVKKNLTTILINKRKEKNGRDNIKANSWIS